MKKAIVHIDMDAFFASVEQRYHPELKGKPVIVGGSIKNRGVVSTASYEAREYGVHSAMPISTAKKLCPNGVFLPVNMKMYKDVSKEIHNILNNYSSIIEPISIDEAFLDLTGKEDCIFIAKKIKDDIWRSIGITSSVGISSNKLLAKLASDVMKPDGFTIIQQEDAVEFLKPLSIRKLWGVGPQTEKELNRLGIYCIGDLQNYDEAVLIKKFGKRGKELSEYSKGVDHRPVETNNNFQSIGEEETFPHDIDNKELLLEKLQEYSGNLSYKLCYKRCLAKTITVKIKYDDFSIETRSFTLTIPTDDSYKIYETSKYILESKFIINKRVRLLGLTLSNFIYPEDPIQLTFEELIK